MKGFLRRNVPGLILAGAFALLSIFLASFGNFLSSATIALLLGMLIGNSKMDLSSVSSGLGFTEKKILEAAIVLLAFGMNAKIFSALGSSTWLFVGVSVIVVIAVALLISKWFGLSFKMGALLGAGSAICGSAAIGAVSPLIQSKEEETGLSIGVINLMSTIGLILLPLLSGFLNLDNEGSGFFIGGVLQSMGHVVGAGFSLGDEVGAAATMVKMGRVLLIIPLMLILFLVNRNKMVGGKKMGFPLFIPLFIIALIIAQIPFFPKDWSMLLDKIGGYLLVAAMVAIGFKIKLKPLFKIAGSALAVGLIVFSFQILIYITFLVL